MDFHTQLYENISLNRLSLFPDVEEILLTYYDLIRLCIVELCAKNADNRKMKGHAGTELDEKTSRIAWRKSGGST